MCLVYLSYPIYFIIYTTTITTMLINFNITKSYEKYNYNNSRFILFVLLSSLTYAITQYAWLRFQNHISFTFLYCFITYALYY